MIEKITSDKAMRVNFRGNTYDTASLFFSTLHSDAESWPFQSGDPEFWKLQETLVKPGGTVLDVGIGTGRSSLFFALHKMQVEGIDKSAESVDFINTLAESFNLPMVARRMDITQTALPQNTYDLALLSHTFIHFPDKPAAYQTLEQVIQTVKPGGHIWLRTPGKEDEGYEEMQQQAEWGFSRKLNRDVFEAPCGCSGEYRDEKHLFFDQTELLQYSLRRGLKVIHSQLMPQQGQANILYGEDYNVETSAMKRNGFISLLLQK